MKVTFFFSFTMTWFMGCLLLSGKRRHPEGRPITFAPMKVWQNLREKIGRKRLLSEKEPQRHRQGTNLNVAKRIGILYKDSDEKAFLRVRSFARSLREQFTAQSVLTLGFIDLPDKHVPVWQQRKLEFDFITRNDLNWYLRPIRNTRKFIEEDFDVLVDLSGGNEVPLVFVLKASKARMKVGWSGSLSASSCDLVFDMKGSTSTELFIQELLRYLSNPKIT